MSMGSEDVEVQCQTQSASACVSCDSSASYGIATLPFVATVSVTANRSANSTPVSASTVMLAHTAASQTPPQNVSVQPSVAASPMPHVQVIQQPLPNQYVQHLYAPHQQHMFLPSNLTLQPAIQGIPGTHPAAISLQLQGKAVDNKTLISASPMQSVGNFGAQNLIPAGTQMGQGAKTCVPSQVLAATSKSTAVIQGQSGFMPATTANQTVVISQLGVLSNPQSVMPHQAKAISDGQKGKSYLISQPTLHPKSPILPQPSVSCAGSVIATSQLKQLPATPHIITTQAPTVIASQVVGSLHALGASLPPGLAWATPGSLQSPALFSQNPIYIRSQQSDMFIQSPSPQATLHAVPVATGPVQQQSMSQQQQPPPQQQIQPQPLQPQQQVQQQTQVQQTQIAPLSILPPPPANTPALAIFKPKPPLRPGSSVATQTVVSPSSSSGNHVSSAKSLSKQKAKLLHSRNHSSNAVQHTTATTQTQTHSPPNQKADAANQTKSHAGESKLAATYNKIIEPFNRSATTESAFSPSVEPVEVEASQTAKPINPTVPDVAVVAPSPVICLVDENIQMDIPEEQNPPVQPPSLPSSGTIPYENIIPNRKDVEADNVGIVAPLPETTVKEKQPQKAIVKPHVLTHVIEGFVIQEGSEPFPVTLPSYTINPKDEKPHDRFNGAIQTNDILTVSKKKDKILKIHGGPVELAKCECCGKLKPKSKFKRSKRFCSTSCAKRFNSGTSKRLAIILPEQELKQTLIIGDDFKKHKKKGKKGKSKKKKLSLKAKKTWKKIDSKIYEEKEWNVVQPQDMAEDVSMEDKESLSVEEDIHVADVDAEGHEKMVTEESLTSSSALEMDVTPIKEEVVLASNEFATKSPLKWTVKDVVDFISDLPGCSDSADEFRAQEIDGQALLLLKEDHLMSLMSMKLGPALKVCAKINAMRSDMNH